MSAGGPFFGLVGGLTTRPARLVAREVQGRGGRFRRGVSRQTTHVVFGRRLLDREGAEAIAARVAAARGQGRTLVSEGGLMRRLGLAPPVGPGTIVREALLAQSQLGERDLEMLALWDAFEHDGPPFSFRDLILARKYGALVREGASWQRIVRAVWRAGPAGTLAATALELRGGSICARAGGRLSELDGQLRLDMDEPAERADALFAEAEAAEGAGRLAAAAALYARCLALDPADATAAFNRANCLRACGRTGEAEAEYARALKLDAEFVEAWFNLACLLAESGRTDAARRRLVAALAVDPRYADAVYNLAKLEFEAGRLAEAERWWRRYLELDEDSEWARAAARGLRLVALRSAAAG